MPSQMLKLNPLEPERLRLSWHRSWKKIAVYWDSELITTVCQADPIETWQTVNLPTGDTLTLCFMIRMGRSTLEVKCNEKILERIDVSSPYDSLSIAFAWTKAIAALHFLILVNLPITRNPEPIRAIGGWILMLGIIYIGLNFFQKSNARLALITASVLYIFESGYIVYDFVHSYLALTFGLNTTYLLSFAIALYYAIQGIQACLPKRVLNNLNTIPTKRAQNNL